MQGRFKPANPHKYIGNPDKIIFRSSWELRLFKYLDAMPGILRWASEEFSIPYLSPIDGKVHQYFPDAFVIYKNKSGELVKEIIEIKPYNESIMDSNVIAAMPDGAQKNILLTNKAKWKAASLFAQRNGLSFRVLTERSLFVKKARNGKKT
jgi:hypothetical protein